MKTKHYIVLLTLFLITAGCRWIDDDLSVCGTDDDYLVNYQMRLVTNVHMTIDEKLSSEVEKPIADALRTWTEPIFSGQAHDLDMDFYSMDGTDELRHHWFEIVDATRKSYTLTIPREDYLHLAVVNIAENDNVTLMGSRSSAAMRLTQRRQDTLPSHQTAVYTARLPMYMTDSTVLTYDVHLYMVSCAVALVVQDSASNDSLHIEQVTLNGSATGFQVKDSVFTFDHPSVLRAQQVTEQCYAVVAFPSADSLTVPTSVPARKQVTPSSLWQLHAYTRLSNGTITESVLDIYRPLKAGTMEIIKVYLHADGSLTTTDAMVGVSVHLDWKQGNEHEVITG